MFTANELEKIRWNLDKLEAKKVLKKQLVLFGYSDNSIWLMNELYKRGYTIAGFIDNNPGLQGKKIMECSTIRVSLAENYLKKYDPTFVFLIVSRFYSEMKTQLEAHGYYENENIYRLICIEDNYLWGNIAEDNYLKRKEQILRGRKIYQEVLVKYQNCIIMVNPVGSIGDVFLMGCYVQKFLEKAPNTVFIFGSITMVKLAQDIGFGKVEYYRKSDIEDIILYARLLGFDRQNIYLLHTGVLAYRIWSRLLTKLGYTWMAHYRELFGLPPDTKPVFPNISVKCIEKVKEFFEKNNLKKKRTVILAPYANTLGNLRNDFWVRLVFTLKRLGYSVCTNVANEREQVIEGTIPITMNVREMKECLEYAGYFISLRNGLCDILGNCKCKKMILYTNEQFDFISVYDFYSLKRMGFTEEVFEYIIDEYNQDDILESIINNVNE